MNNDDVTTDDLPDLSDDDVEIVHEICRRASHSSHPPFKALFAAYDQVFAEQQIEQEHDGVVFRLLLRVGQAARSQRGGADLVGRLKDVLQAHGITVIDHDDEEVDEVTRSSDAPAWLGGITRGNATLRRRRVSFDDARLEETWLSEHASNQDRVALAKPRNLLTLPPRRGRVDGSRDVERRARSTSSSRLGKHSRQPAPKHAPASSVYDSDVSEHDVNPTLLFQPSQTQLEQNAEAFSSTTALRSARKALHAWYNVALNQYTTRQQAYLIASAHDRRTLLKQALDQWHTALLSRLQEHRLEAHWDRVEKRTELAYKTRILERAFTHWATSSQDQKLATAVAHTHMLKIRYFRRWKQIATDTSERVWKVQSILARKWLSVWRDKVVRRQLREEQAVALYEEGAVKRCWRSWFWHFCSRRVDGWHEQKVKARLFGRLRTRLEFRIRQQATAQVHYNDQVVQLSFGALTSHIDRRQQAHELSRAHHRRKVESRVLRSIAISAGLQPAYQIIKLKATLSLQRKAFRVWHLHLDLLHQAAEVDRKRILQNAWNSWNETLRCRALAQRIDERVVIESLYKWVLQERLSLFVRARDSRTVARSIAVWHAKVGKVRGALLQAKTTFAQDERRRRLAMGMVKLNLALRRREDAERAALEMRNARLLPSVLNSLQQETARMRELDQWALHARFYTLCTRSLRVWQERTTQHQQNRRRVAYAHIRARVKVRLVGSCLARWQGRCAHVRDQDVEAARRSQERLFATGAQAFDRWRENATRLAALRLQAKGLDRQKLIGSALAVLTIRTAELSGLDGQAAAFRVETDNVIMSSAFKKLQWAQFTVARKIESAEALWARSRDAHIRSMLRVWVAQAATKRAQQIPSAPQEALEPESPSLRPASRARTRSADRSTMVSPPQRLRQPATPAYLRTPSRSRRAGRFRSLPTPVPVTPFAFDQSYLATTPAPLPVGNQDHLATTADNAETLTPQVTPFSRKLRASGIAPTPAPALRSSVLGRSLQAGGGTAKSVRFRGGSGSRLGVSAHLKGS